jgi:hypothetical protein
MFILLNLMCNHYLSDWSVLGTLLNSGQQNHRKTIVQFFVAPTQMDKNSIQLEFIIETSVPLLLRDFASWVVKGSAYSDHDSLSNQLAEAGVWTCYAKRMALSSSPITTHHYDHTPIRAPDPIPSRISNKIECHFTDPLQIFGKLCFLRQPLQSCPLLLRVR